MNRSEFLCSLVERDAFGLEIGPGHSPVFPKADGWNVEIADYAPTDYIRAMRAAEGGNPAFVEEVDHVTDGRSLEEVVPKEIAYDFIFSSHNIEHLPDIIGFLKSCDNLLKKNGKVILVIPDKRFTFDALRNTSTTGEALEAYQNRLKRHTSRSIYDYNANILFMDGKNTWGRDDFGSLLIEKSVQTAKVLFDRSIESEEYIDNHGWCLTPASFRLMLHDFNELGLVEVQEEWIVDQQQWEFYAVLSRKEKSQSVDRLDLVKDLIRENILSGLQLLGFDDPVMKLAMNALRGPDPEKVWI